MKQCSPDVYSLDEPYLCCGSVRLPAWAKSVTRRDVLRALVDLGIEIAIVYCFLKAYNVVRNKFGSIVVSPAQALAHARQVSLSKQASSCC